VLRKEHRHASKTKFMSEKFQFPPAAALQCKSRNNKIFLQPEILSTEKHSLAN
jgi:hypothetical protein